MSTSQIEFSPLLVGAARAAQRVTVLTGAGILAESGAPTCREARTGLWATYRPEELAVPEAFQRNPKLVWEWYAWRRASVAHTAPNPSHLALAELERRVSHFTLITQYVDGLHARAGNRHILELQGNLNRVKCYREDRVITPLTLHVARALAGSAGQVLPALVAAVWPLP